MASLIASQRSTVTCESGFVACPSFSACRVPGRLPGRTVYPPTHHQPDGAAFIADDGPRAGLAAAGHTARNIRQVCQRQPARDPQRGFEHGHQAVRAAFCQHFIDRRHRARGAALDRKPISPTRRMAANQTAITVALPTRRPGRRPKGFDSSRSSRSLLNRKSRLCDSGSLHRVAQTCSTTPSIGSVGARQGERSIIFIV